MAAAETESKDLLAKISSIKDQLTEEEIKGSLGKMLSYTSTAVSSGVPIYKVVEDVRALNKMNDYIGKVETLLNKLVKTSHTKEEIVKKTQDFHAKNATGVMSDFDFCPCIVLNEPNIDDTISEAEKIKKQILDALKDHQRQTSDNMIKDMWKASRVAAVLQFVKLYMAWKTISAASNVIEDKNKFTQINKNLQKMESMVMEFVEICDTRPEDKGIDRKMSRINTLFTSTVSKISSIEVKIKGHIERLEITSDYAAVDVFSSSTTAFSQAYQVWNAWENLSSPSKWLGLLSVGMHAAFSVGHAAVFVISQDKMKELRKELREAIYLQERLEDLRQQAEDALFGLRE